MNSRTVKLKQFTPKNSPAYPYKEYESHPYWKQLDKAISALVKNQDLLERTAPHTSSAISAKHYSAPRENLSKIKV
jgi:hypothetical protein